MTKTVAVSLMLLAFALPAHAGQWIIEETDDCYFVEYLNDSVEKPVEKPVATLHPPTAQPASTATPVGQKEKRHTPLRYPPKQTNGPAGSFELPRPGFQGGKPGNSDRAEQ